MFGLLVASILSRAESGFASCFNSKLPNFKNGNPAATTIRWRRVIRYCLIKSIQVLFRTKNSFYIMVARFIFICIANLTLIHLANSIFLSVVFEFCEVPQVNQNDIPMHNRNNIYFYIVNIKSIMHLNSIANFI